MITIKEVSELAKVSQSTVSRALNGHPTVKEANRKKVFDAIEKLGYKPNAFGLWSLRRYSIAMVVKSFGIYLGTRQAQHNKATGSTVQSTYDADNGSLEVGAAEMDRPPEDIEPGTRWRRLANRRSFRFSGRRTCRQGR